MRSPSRLFVAAVLCAGLSAFACPAWAGRITLKIRTTVDAAAGLRVDQTITNQGDEAAHNVVPRWVVHKYTGEGSSLAKLGPGQSHTWHALLHDGPVAPAAYTLLTKIAYEDANRYPFEVLAVTAFNAATSRRPVAAGHFSIPVFDSDRPVPAKLDIRLPRGRSTRELEIEVFLPRGMSPGSVKRRVTLSDSREANLSLELRNQSLIPGTTLRVFALLTSLDEQPPQTDSISGRIIVRRPKPVLTRNGLNATLTVALALLALFMILAGREGDREYADSVWTALIETCAVAATVGILLYHFPWGDLLAPTTTAGGDMASLYYPTKVMAEDLLPSGRWSGWTMGNYAGFPIFHFYSTFPFALIALLGHLFSMQVAFKLVTLLGVTTLPVCAAYLMRSLGYGRAAAAMAAAAMLPFLFQQGNSMWGGNIPSVLAGEFCHSIGISLSLVFAGMLHRTSHGKLSWVWPALLLAIIGLCHTFAFIAAAWYSLYYLWPRRDAPRLWRGVLPVYLLAFLLLCFWGLPVPSRLKFTTEWSVIWNIKSWTEVVPAPLWPAAGLTAADLGLLAAGLLARGLARLGIGGAVSAAANAVTKWKPFDAEREGFLLFVLAGMVLLYFVTPAIGFPDIRFIPIAQIFLGLAAADFLYWVANRIGQRTILAVCVVLAAMAWTEAHLGYIPSWLAWNYSGYERKPTWDLFKSINDHVHGDRNDPRIVFEHSEAHNRFGSSRAFENLPLFSGRSTLEGVFHQASPNSPFVFYLQSEASEKASGPFRQYTYTRLAPDKALPHFRLYDVSDVIVVSDAAKKAYSASPNYTKTFSRGDYEVFHVAGGDTGYVTAATSAPVLYEGRDWKLAFYRWFKHPELLDVPLVPAALLPAKQSREFELRTDSITRIPHKPLSGECDIHSHLEQHKIRFTTSCPGRPHIVKVSYFPLWHASDGSPVQLVSPGFMLVYPKHTSFELVYGRNAVDYAGISLSVFGLLALLVLVARPSWAETVADACVRPFSSGLVIYERNRTWLAVALICTGIAASAATRLSLRSPDRAYREAQQSYRAREFKRTVALLTPLVAQDQDTFKQATALFQLGVSHSELGNHTAAVQVLERLLFDFPNVNYGASTRFHLARSYAALGIGAKAEEHARALQKIAPDSVWTRRLQREQPGLLR